MGISAERIREAMENSGITQSELSQLSGVPKSSLSSWLSGLYEPKQNAVYALAKALNVSEAWLMGFDVRRQREQSKRSGTRLPVLGDVPCGIPVEAIEIVGDEWEEIPKELADSGTFFALRAKGDSMAPRIQEGDVLIVRQQEDADSGDVVIAKVNGDDACCKKLLKQGIGIVLQSFNPAFEPMYFSDDDIKEKPVTIIGKVIENRQKF